MLWRVLLALATAAACAPANEARDREVVVSAATSLTNVLQRVADVHRSASGDRILLNLGASNTLARQIAAGSAVDVFISADEAQMDQIAADIVPGTRVDLLSNQLAIAVPDTRVDRFASARELIGPSIRRIAIGDPAGVPAGVYAKRYLQQAGLWPLVESKLVLSGSVRLALAAVENGAADAAVVYRTDIPAARGAREAFVVPVADGPAIRYPAAAVRTGRNPAGANRFLAFLRSAEAAAIFAHAGFRPIGHGSSRRHEASRAAPLTAGTHTGAAPVSAL